MNDLTHIDAEGNAVMVNVSAKNITERKATAAGSVYMLPETLKLIINSGVKKRRCIERRTVSRNYGGQENL